MLDGPGHAKWPWRRRSTPATEISRALGGEARHVLAAVLDIGEIVEPHSVITRCRDEADNRVLECAVWRQQNVDKVGMAGEYYSRVRFD